MYYKEDDPYAVDNGSQEDSTKNLFGDYSTSKHETVGAHWTPTLIFSGLALISAIICAVIGWILFDRWKNDWLLSFSIISTVAVLLFAFFAFWAFNNNRKRGTDAEYHPSAVTELIVWVMALLFMVFFAVAGVAMFVYFPSHESFMREKKADSEYWEKKWGDDLPTEWEKESNLLIVIAAFSLVAAVSMVFVAFNTYSMSIRRYNLNVTMFLIAAVGVFAFGFGVVVHYQDIQWWLQLYNDQSSYTPYKLILFMVFIFAIISIVMAFLNVLLSYTRNSFFYFFFLFAILVLCIITAIFMAEYGQSLQNNLSADMWKNGRSILYETHENDVKKFCDSTKYLQPDKACSNRDIVNKWETSKYELASLNQNCYGNASRFMFWKYFIMFLLGMFLVMFLALLTLTNLFLLRDPETQKPNVFYLVVVGLMFLAAIGLAIYLILGYKPSSNKTYISSNDVIDTKFKTVNPELTQPPVKGTSLCNTMAELKSFSLTGTDTDHGRLAILVQNGEINGLKAYDLGPNQRLTFFNDLNSKNNFYLLKGTKKELNAALLKSEVCSENSSQSSDAYFKWEPVNAADLDGNGLKRSENLSMPNLTPTGTSYNGTGSTKTNSCDSSCLANVDLSSDSTVPFTLPIFVNKIDGTPGMYKFPETGLRVEILNEDYSSNGHAVITQDSKILLNAHTFINKSYPVLLRITDNDDYYTQNIIRVNIPSKEQIDSGRSSTTLSPVILLTKNGKGCAGTTNITKYKACVTNGKADWKTGDINVNVFDAVTGEMISEPVVVSKYHADDKYHVETLTTTDGKAKSSALKYGSYNLSVDSATYEKNLKLVSLQKNSETINLILVPKEGSVNRITDVSDVNHSQFDLNLMMENKSKDQCIVNSFNKICPGAKMVSDYTKNNKRIQVIDVEDYKNANYMVFLSPLQKFTSSCELSKQFSRRRLEGSSDFGGWNMKSFDSLLSLLNGVDFFQSGMGDSESTTNSSFFTPVSTQPVDTSDIKPYIQKEPFYDAIMVMVDKEYETPEEKTQALLGLANNDEEKNKIVKAGQDVYSDLNNKDDREWMNTMKDAYIEDDEDYVYDDSVDHDENWDDYNYDINDNIEEENTVDETDELCEYFGICWGNNEEEENEEGVEEEVVEADTGIEEEVVQETGEDIINEEPMEEQIENENEPTEEQNEVESTEVKPIEEEIVEEGTSTEGETESVEEEVIEEGEPTEDEAVEEEVIEEGEPTEDEAVEEEVIEEGTPTEDEAVEEEVIEEGEPTEDEAVEEEVVEEGEPTEDETESVEEEVVEEGEPTEDEAVEEEVIEEGEPTEDEAVEEEVVEEGEPTEDEAVEEEVAEEGTPTEDETESVEEEVVEEGTPTEDESVEEEVAEEGEPTEDEAVEEEVVEEGEPTEDEAVEEEVVEEGTPTEGETESVEEEVIEEGTPTEDETESVEEEVVEEGTPTEDESVEEEVAEEGEPTEDEAVEEEVVEEGEPTEDEAVEEEVVEEGTPTEGETESVEEEVIEEGEPTEDEAVEEEVVEEGTPTEDEAVEEEVIEEGEPTEDEAVEEEVVEEGTPTEDEAVEEEVVEEGTPTEDEAVEEEVVEEGTPTEGETESVEEEVVEEGTPNEGEAVEEEVTEEMTTNEETPDETPVEETTEDVATDKETTEEEIIEEPQIIPGTEDEEIVEHDGEELEEETLAPAEHEVFEDTDELPQEGIFIILNNF
jgi:hypothetical protein